MENNLWVEKYKPKTFDEVVGQEPIVKILKNLSRTKFIPNSIFTGASGTGKSLSCKILIKNIYGDSSSENVLWIDGASDRGIMKIREIADEYLPTYLVDDSPFKTIIFESAECLTLDAFYALRFILEQSSEMNRFILICNSLAKIPSFIQSHCFIFRFNLIDKDDVVKKLEKIGEQAGLSISREVCSIIYDSSNKGDLRSNINNLQHLIIYANNNEINENLTKQFFRSQVTDQIITRVVDTCLNKEEDIVNNYKYVNKLLSERSIDSIVFLRRIHNYLMFKLDKEKIKGIKFRSFLDVLAEAEYRIINGCNPELQLNLVLNKLSSI